MTLIKSVSGMRGTIGGAPGNNLTPLDIVEFAAAYGMWLRSRSDKVKVVLGRDGRRSGAHVQSLVSETLTACGIDVIDLGQSTTPTVEVYVPHVGANGGIIITASHNPEQWNALKFLNEKGEFISKDEGEQLITAAASKHFEFAQIDDVGSISEVTDAIAFHVDLICGLELVQVEKVRSQKFHVIVDCVNSTGAKAIPPLLDALGCTYTLLNAEVTGRFAHNPEPLASHLSELMAAVRDENAALGIAVDPDVDRLAFVSEDGAYFGEEYTLVAVADYILNHNPGNTVSNLSSTKALKDITESRGGTYSASPVGEVHVVAEMKRTNAVIGGEGNGGVIYPKLHYGRDALVGIALMLSYLAESQKSMSELRMSYPDYKMVKDKIRLDGLDPDTALENIKSRFSDNEIDTRDGVKVLFEDSWVHLRKSNTEPIVRVYAEHISEQKAAELVNEVKAIALT